jgi:hypothetical protein
LEARPQDRQGRTIGGRVRSSRPPARYEIQKGDTLWDITGRFFGSPWKWPQVWSYNPEVTNPHWIYPDDTLRLRPEEEGKKGLPRADDDIEYAARERRDAGPDSVFLREQGFLDRDALEASGEIVGSPSEKMLLSPYDEVYVQFDQAGERARGQELTVFRRYEKAGETEESAAPEQVKKGEGVLVRILGTIRVDSYDPERKMARGVIVEALDPIERGFKVADVPRRFEMVDPRENQVNVVTEVVAALRPRELLADQQLVFVGAGAEEGVRKGNRFFVVRRGDGWRETIQSSPEEMGAAEPDAPEAEQYPPNIIAEGRVVDVRPHTSALLITRSTGPVRVGDRIEMRKGF